MRTKLACFLALIVCAQSWGQTVYKPDEKLIAAAVSYNQDPVKQVKPLLYAVSVPGNLRIINGVPSVGGWVTGKDGTSAWTYRYVTPGAKGSELNFSTFQLSVGATLTLAAEDGQQAAMALGPGSRNPLGGLVTPFSPGENFTLTVKAPTAAVSKIQLVLNAVSYAFLNIFSEDATDYRRSGSCNVDVACPSGSSVADFRRSIARYTFPTSMGSALCTGALIHNTRDRAALGTGSTAIPRKLFLTANHCVSTSSQAAAITLYWGYENPGCRAPGSAQSGRMISLRTGGALAQAGGASLLAGSPARGGTDFSLLELNGELPPEYAPVWAGWNRSATAPSSAFIIHHPAGHEKRITHTFNRLSTMGWTPEGRSGRFWATASYDMGTTEGGSSGSPLFNPRGEIIGQLYGGPAACGNTVGDDYGRFDLSWEGGGTPASRLKDWLDPDNTGRVMLDARFGDGRPAFPRAVQIADLDGDFPLVGGGPPLQISVPVMDAHVGDTLYFAVYGDFARVGDLRASLTHPDGRMLPLTISPFDSRRGRGYTVMFYLADNALGALNGDWLLQLADPVSGRAGTVNSVFLHSNYGDPLVNP